MGCWQTRYALLFNFFYAVKHFFLFCPYSLHIIPSFMYVVYMQISFRAPTAMCRAYVSLAISASATYTPHMILGALKLMYMKSVKIYLETE